MNAILNSVKCYPLQWKSSKKDTKQGYPALSSTTMEEVQNTKTKPKKKLDFVFCIVYSTRIGLRPFLVGEQSSKYKVGCFIDFVLCILSRLVPCGATKYKKCVFTDLSRPRILRCNVSTYKLQK